MPFFDFIVGPEQTVESIKKIEGSVKEKYKSVPKFDDVIKKIKSLDKKDLNSKSWLSTYNNILNNLDKSNPQDFNGNVLRIISHIIQIINQSKEDSKINNKIKEKLKNLRKDIIKSRAKGNSAEARELKKQVADELYHKLVQFSGSYDRSLISEYFPDRQIGILETKLKLLKGTRLENQNRLKSLAYTWSSDVSNRSNEHLDAIF
jgi:hypothetical protein